MGIADRYQAYADAFEQTFEDDDWSRIEPYFSDDAVYAGGPGDAVGRDAVIAKLRNGLNRFDRKMDSRSLSFEPPTVDGDTLEIRWGATYTKAGAPDLAISGLERARFQGDRITRLEDEFDPQAEKAMGEWMAAHGAKLQ